MIVDLHVSPSVEYTSTGGKAFNLHRLITLGMPVPRVIVVPHDVDIDDASNQTVLFDHPLFEDKDRLFAVRSSGNGEDSENNSYAGIFDTFLDVPYLHVIESIKKVRNSSVSIRSSAYSKLKGVSVQGMNVIVQHMVPADYAGVAFTMSPIEKDLRIMLIEMVVGNGEALVSGKITPTTIRYNKLTKLMSIEQVGGNSIQPIMIEEIITMLVPFLINIEKAYECPVDVEWAFHDRNVFILQARPITA